MLSFEHLRRFAMMGFILSILMTSSCVRSRLAVYTDYVCSQSLASYYVGTPDPLLNNPPVGQRLIIIWTLQKKHLCCPDLHLKISLRFKNRKEIEVNHNIDTPQGTYVYAVLNQDYLETQGIQTYKVELISEGCILDEWRHQIWTNLISVGQGQGT